MVDSYLCKKWIKYKLRGDLSINEPGMVESGFIEIELDKIIYIVGEIYQVSNTSEKIFNEKYCELPNVLETKMQSLVVILILTI